MKGTRSALLVLLSGLELAAPAASATADLAITRVHPADSKPGTTTLRISKLSDVRGETVDLSTLPPTP